MLKRVLIDNFRCFSNFEFRPGAQCLIIGENGTGKTSFLDAISILRELVVVGGPVEDLLTVRTATAWRRSEKQTFELDVAIPSGQFRYTLIVDRLTPTAKARVFSERVYLDGVPVFVFNEGTLQLINDGGEEKVQYPSDWYRSGLATVQSRPDNQRLMEFKSWFGALHCIRPDPRLLRSSLATGESSMPGYEFQWFLTWYRSMLQERPIENEAFRASLKEVLSDFETIRFEKFGPQSKILTLDFNRGSSGRPYPLDFHELSDGQKMLILLYSVLHFLLVDGRTIIIDEPDNYVSLREIQPWLLEVERRMADDGQLLIISHHPELLTNYSTEDIFHFRRISEGVIRAEPISLDPSSGLSLYERVARGWLGE